MGWIHLYPSKLDAEAQDTAKRVAFDAVRALGLRNGIAFPQLLVTPAGEALVVEVAARIPAGQMADLVRLGIGVDLVEVALMQALGQTVTDDMITPRFERPLAIRFLTASPGILPTGRVTAIDVIAAWVFVAGRVVHTLVQTLTDNVPLRGQVFMINFLALVVLAAHVAAIAFEALGDSLG